jgi:ADP-ribose pyrophosphatase YjhB (NUDIX family)
MDEIELKFCPRCGHVFSPVPPQLLRCRTCHLEWFINPRPCNAIIIANDRGEILLTKRAHNPAKGLWDLPGGFVNIGETLEQSVIREGYEELGVQLGDVEYLFSGPDRYLFSGINAHTIGAVFRAVVKGGTLKANDDVAEIRFVPVDKVPYDKLAFPVLRETLRKFRNMQKG